MAETKLSEEIAKENKLTNELSVIRNQDSLDRMKDDITGLPSRRVFEDRLKVIIGQSKRYHLTFAVLCLDLDGFKMINEALGYEAGDILLKEVAARLEGSIRQVDTISRFSGDDFVFIFPQLTKAETAAYLAQRFLDDVSQPFNINGKDIYLTASIGITIFPTDGDDAKRLISNAESALHQAKSRGRNNYQFYREEMNAISRRDLILSTDLHHEKVFDDFTITYQPQVDSVKNEIACMEAQLSWNHPDLGLIPWFQLSRLAEHINRSLPIGEWLLKSVCNDFNVWKANGFFAKTLSVQLTMKQIESFHFIQFISTTLNNAKIDAESLIIEIPELSLTSKFEVVEKMLHMLKRLGVQITINNFGTGHLSLQHLRSLPIDMLKIDSVLVKDITINKESAAIVKMITVLSKSLNLKIIADGVENINQIKLLQELGCTVMQGPFFAESSLPQAFTSGASIQKVHI